VVEAFFLEIFLERRGLHFLDARAVDGGHDQVTRACHFDFPSQPFAVFLHALQLEGHAFLVECGVLQALQRRGALRKPVAAVEPHQDGVADGNAEVLWHDVGVMCSRVPGGRHNHRKT
jgi:hypothetical protein